MTRTRRKKRFVKERKVCNPGDVCLKCDGSMKNASHHFFCNDCYTPGLMYSEEIRRKIKGRGVKRLDNKVVLKNNGEIAIINTSWGCVEYVVKKGDKLILKKTKVTN